MKETPNRDRLVVGHSYSVVNFEGETIADFGVHPDGEIWMNIGTKTYRVGGRKRLIAWADKYKLGWNDDNK